MLKARAQHVSKICVLIVANEPSAKSAGSPRKGRSIGSKTKLPLVAGVVAKNPPPS